MADPMPKPEQGPARDIAQQRLVTYIQAALTRGVYEDLEEEGFYGEIPGFQGVWANAPSLEACRKELAEALESWLMFRLARRRPVPVVDGIDLTHEPAGV